MYTSTEGYYSHIKAHEGKLLSVGNILTREIYFPSNANVGEIKEVSEIVLLTPEEQLKKFDDMQSLVTNYEELKNTVAELQARINELGKIEQTDEGDGSDMNPYKWKEGDYVENGKWYKTPNYIWEAIASGYPTSETDTNYFDVVGI